MTKVNLWVAVAALVVSVAALVISLVTAAN